MPRRGVKLTRGAIKNSRKQTLVWFKKNMTKVNKLAVGITRDKNISISYDYIETLNNIELICDNTFKHWAETDGITISLNVWKKWSKRVLKYTLIHECIHYLIKRENGHYLSEYKEHKLMESINPLLI